MDARYINPFIIAASNVMDVMAGVKIVRGTPAVRDKFQTMADISGIVGFAGDAQGAVVLSFPMDLARLVYQRMTGDTAPADMAAIADAVGELANMVVGGAKVQLSEMKLDVQISIPSVVAGLNHTVSVKNSGPCLVVPFEVENNQTFWVQLNMRTET